MQKFILVNFTATASCQYNDCKGIQAY